MLRLSRSSVLALVIVPTLVSSWPARASAQPAEAVEAETEVQTPTEAAPPAKDPAIAEAKKLFIEGASKYETADYAGAIELWTKAYGLVPNEPENAQIKAKLIANMAKAHERSYEVDGDIAHLNQARMLLENYDGVIDDIYPDPSERAREHGETASFLEKIEAKVAADEQRRADAAKNDGQSTEAASPGRGAMITGAVFTGLGAAGLGVMAGGMFIGQGANDIDDIGTDELTAREARFARGRMGNALAIAGGIGGVVLLATGVGLLVVGSKKKRASDSPESAPTVRLLPSVSPRNGGLVLSGRF